MMVRPLKMVDVNPRWTSSAENDDVNAIATARAA